MVRASLILKGMTHGGDENHGVINVVIPIRTWYGSVGTAARMATKAQSSLACIEACADVDDPISNHLKLDFSSLLATPHGTCSVLNSVLKLNSSGTQSIPRH